MLLQPLLSCEALVYALPPNFVLISTSIASLGSQSVTLMVHPSPPLRTSLRLILILKMFVRPQCLHMKALARAEIVFIYFSRYMCHIRSCDKRCSATPRPRHSSAFSPHQLSTAVTIVISNTLGLRGFPHSAICPRTQLEK